MRAHTCDSIQGSNEKQGDDGYVDVQPQRLLDKHSSRKHVHLQKHTRERRMSEEPAFRRENSPKSWWKCKGRGRWRRGRCWSWLLQSASSGTGAWWSPEGSTLKPSHRKVEPDEWRTYSSCEVDGHKQPAKQQHNEQSLTEKQDMSVWTHIWVLVKLFYNRDWLILKRGSDPGSYIPFKRSHRDAAGRPGARQPHEVTATNVTGEERRANLIWKSIN